jgi:hypothetical protein
LRATDEGAEHHRGRACVIESGVRGRDVEAELLDQARETRCLALRQIEDQARQRGRVDDRVLERTLQTATDEPRVERVVAMLDQHGCVGESQEGTSGVFELRSADEHRAVDVVAFARVGIDRSAAVDERVEERKRPLQREPFRSDLEDEERRVARRLHVERDELGVVESRLGADLRSVDRDLLPGHRLGRAARLEEQLPRRRAHLAIASARRAHAISSPLRARRSRIAAA